MIENVEQSACYVVLKKWLDDHDAKLFGDCVIGYRAKRGDKYLDPELGDLYEQLVSANGCDDWNEAAATLASGDCDWAGVNKKASPPARSLRVKWIPQIPMKPFIVPVDNEREAAKVMDILSAYDLFQYENNVKPDYSNMGALEIFDADDTEDSPEGSWVGWFDEETGFDDFGEWREEQAWNKTLDACFTQMRESSKA